MLKARGLPWNAGAWTRTLALLAVALVAAASQLSAAPPAAAAVGNCTPSTGWPAARADLAQEVVTLVNSHRASLGLSSLSVSPTLTASATWKARHMAYYRYMAHNDPAPPVSRSVGQRLEACGYSGGGWGENIAYGYSTAAAVMQAWLKSSGHRANIENPSFRSIGVGAAVASNGSVYWAQNFGAAAAGGTPPASSPSPPSTSAPTSGSTRPVTVSTGGKPVPGGKPMITKLGS
jgi:uncharacterized protein YkwD